MDEQMIEQIARAMKPELFEGGPDETRGPATRYERDFARKMARAAHSVIAGKVAGLEEALKQAALDLHEAAGRFAIHTELDLLACSELTRKAARRADAALAPYPERRSE